MKKLILTAVVAAGFSVPTAAQDPAQSRMVEQNEAARREIEVAAQARAAIGVESRITTGAPYSAEAVTESNQVLADGNRIARKTMSRIYRDGEGRTRREEIDPETGNVKSAVISDPVAHVTYSLDPANRTATKSQVYIATPSGVMPTAQGGRGGGAGGGGAVVSGGFGGARGGGGGGSVMVPVEAPQAAEVRAKAVEEKTAKAAAEGGTVKPAPAAPVPTPARVAVPLNPPTVEQLGTQAIEGVPATGTRSTIVIPAGQIGNLQAIKIVSEQWTSADLKVLVLTKHSDPRSGETTYKLQSIVRAEPDRSLFLVPPDYTVRDLPVRRPMVPQINQIK